MIFTARCERLDRPADTFLPTIDDKGWRPLGAARLQHRAGFEPLLVYGAVRKIDVIPGGEVMA